jgi:hypothetical protein
MRKRKRDWLAIVLLAALLAISGCVSAVSHGPNGITCETESRAFLLWGSRRNTCRDAAGNVIQSSTASLTP